MPELYWVDISLNTPNRWPGLSKGWVHLLPRFPFFPPEHKAAHNVQSDKYSSAHVHPLPLRSYTSLASSAVVLQGENSGIGTAEVDESSCEGEKLQGQAVGPSPWHVMLIGFVLCGHSGEADIKIKWCCRVWEQHTASSRGRDSCGG